MPHSYEFKLQIVCGTYNRTDSAIRLIKSAIPHLNEDIGLVVHSNSPDKKLKHFMIKFICMTLNLVNQKNILSQKLLDQEKILR